MPLTHFALMAVAQLLLYAQKMYKLNVHAQAKSIRSDALLASAAHLPKNTFLQLISVSYQTSVIFIFNANVNLRLW